MRSRRTITTGFDKRRLQVTPRRMGRGKQTRDWLGGRIVHTTPIGGRTPANSGECARLFHPGKEGRASKESQAASSDTSLR
jgi:hypothetical protein